MFGRLAVELRIDVAIDFDAILVVAPAIDDVVAVGVDEFAQHLAVAVAHDPAGLAFAFFSMDRAAGGFGGRWAIVIDVGLDRRELQGLLGGGRGGSGAGRADRAQTAAAAEPSPTLPVSSKFRSHIAQPFIE